MTKNCNDNEQVVQIELKSHVDEVNVQEIESSSFRYMSITVQLQIDLDALSSHQPGMILKIWFLMHLLLVAGILLPFRRQCTT